MRFGLLCCLSSMCALTAVDLDTEQQQLVGLWEHPFEEHFTIGHVSGTWDQAERYAAEYRLFQVTDERFSPWGGVHVGWDEREGTFSNGGEIEAQALVVALTGGVGLHLLREERHQRLDPTISLVGRMGVGFQDGRIKDYPLEDLPGFNPGDTGSADLAPLRYEFGLCLEGSIVIARRLVVTAGMGTTWWFANESTSIVLTNGGGGVAVEADYAGGELWTHLGAGVTF